MLVCRYRFSMQNAHRDAGYHGNKNLHLGDIHKVFFPQQDTGRLSGNIRASQDISFQAMRQKLTEMGEIIQSDPAVDTVMGFTGGGGESTTNTGRMFISLKPLEERKLSVDQVIARLRSKLATVPGAPTYLQTVQDLRIGGRVNSAQYQRRRQSISGSPRTKKIDPKRLWQTYLDVGNFRARMIRGASIVALFLPLGVMFMIGIDQELPPAPSRGPSAYWANLIVTLLSAFCLLFLIAFLFDTFRLSRLMIEQLNLRDADRRLKKQNPMKTRVSQYRLKAESEWWDVRFAAEHTDSITYLFYFPIVALFLMILARNPIFDAWYYSMD